VLSAAIMEFIDATVALVTPCFALTATGLNTRETHSIALPNGMASASRIPP